jgi:hypothetical protein
VSANNAIYVAPVEWYVATRYENGKPTHFDTFTYWFVFNGDADQWGELANNKRASRKLLWQLLLDRAVMHHTYADAVVAAHELMDKTSIVEYGIVYLDKLAYKKGPSPSNTAGR